MNRAGILLLMIGGILLGAGCGTPPKVVRLDPEMERNVALARNAFAAGSAEKAVVYYRKALNRARLMDDPVAIGHNAYNLAACLMRLNRDEEARSLLDEAESEFRRAGIVTGEIPLLRARLAHRAGKTDDALTLVKSQLQAATPKTPYFLQYQILLVDLLCAKGDAAGAAQAMARVNVKSLAAEDLSTQADAAGVRARIALAEGKPGEAGGFLDAAAGHLQKAGHYVEMALALDKAGRAYEAAGDPDAALDRYYRSIRSLFLSGEIARAERGMTRAVLLADRSGQPVMQAKLKQLQTDLNASRNAAAREP